jgi:hypothetical protein
MKRLISILTISFLLLVSIKVQSDHPDIPCPNQICNFDYTTYKCMIDGIGIHCIDVTAPVPPDCFNPCIDCCVTVPPAGD